MVASGTLTLGCGRHGFLFINPASFPPALLIPMPASGLMEIVHVVPAQNVSWAAASAKPPAARTLMSFVVLSDARLTWIEVSVKWA